MNGERALLDRLRDIAAHPAARGLADDAALLDGMVLTHDTMVEGVHFLPRDPARGVALRLVAVNLSDLAAKGAAPAGMLLSLAMGADADWDRDFLDGIAAAQARWGCPLLGGDTVALPAGAPRVLGLTAIGRAGPRTPSRSGARPGDTLWLAGTLGDAGAGLAMLLDDRHATGALVEAYRTPEPLLAAGAAAAGLAGAMMDVSDGLLIDAARMAAASGVALGIDLDALPLSAAFIARRGGTGEARLFAAAAGDDYALLAAVPPAAAADMRGAGFVAIGTVEAPDAGEATGGDAAPAVRLHASGRPLALPERLGWMHERSAQNG